MLARIAMLIGGMLLLILIVPAASEGQTRFEIAAGTHYGLQQRPLTAGWIVSGGFQIDQQQDFVVEGAWHRRMTTSELRFSFDDFGDDVGRQIYRSRYLMLAAGVRGGQRQGRISPFYQVLLGGISTRFRTDYEWPTAIDVEAENANCGGFVGDELVHPCLNVPYPEFEEERKAGFLMQPGVGLDVLVQRRLKLRLVTDLLVIADRDYVVLAPRLSARIVVGFGGQ